MSDAPNSGDSPVGIHEAESTQDSPEMEQDFPQSPDSTIGEGGSHVEPSTSAEGPMPSTNENRIKPDDPSALGFITENFANANLINKVELTSAPTTSTAELSSSSQNKLNIFGSLATNSAIDNDSINQTEQISTFGHVTQSNVSATSTRCPRRPGDPRETNKMNRNILTVNSAVKKNIINKGGQSGESGRIAQSCASTGRTKNSSAKPRQVDKQEERSSASTQMAEPSLSTVRSESSPGKLLEQNPPLTNIIMVNPAANENLINLRQRSTSVPLAEFGASAERPMSSLTQPLQIFIPGEQSSASGLPQPRTRTARSTSNPQQPSDRTAKDLLLTTMLMFNEAVRENLIYHRQQSSASSRIDQSSASTAGPSSRPAQPHQVVKQGNQSSDSRQIAQSILFTGKSASRRAKLLEDNPLLSNMIWGNPDANDNLINRGQQSSASGPVAQSSTSTPKSHPSQPRQDNKGEQSFPSKQPQPSSSTDRISSSSQKYVDRFEGKPLRTSVLNPAVNKNLINRGKQSSASRLILESRAASARRSSLPSQSRSVVKQEEQSSASRLMAQTSETTARLESQAAQPRQVNKQEQCSSRQVSKPSLSTAKGESSHATLLKKNPLLSNIMWGNPAANENLNDQRQQSSVSGSVSQSSVSERPKTRPGKSRRVNKKEQSSASKLPQPSTPTEVSSSSSQQDDDRVERNQLLTSNLMVKPDVNENFINSGTQSSKSGPITESRASTSRRESRPSQPRQVVKEEQRSASKLTAKPSPYTAKSTCSTSKSVKKNPKLPNAQASVYTKKTLTRPSQLSQVHKQGEQNSASKLPTSTAQMAQSSLSTESASERMAEPGTQSARNVSGPAQPCQVSEQNRMPTNTFKHESINEDMSNRGESSSSSAQTVPESPSRRKREGEASEPQPSCSPTKKVKSLNKK